MCQLNQQSIIFLLRSLTGVERFKMQGEAEFDFPSELWALSTLIFLTIVFITCDMWRNLRAPSLHQQNGNI